jgi:hypothetical protein
MTKQAGDGATACLCEWVESQSRHLESRAGFKGRSEIETGRVMGS